MTHGHTATGPSTVGGYEALPYARRGLAYRLFLLGSAAVWWALGAPFRRGWVVLCYHGVSDGQAAGFAEQVRMLRHRAGGVDEVGETPVRGVRVAVTFDDAFENLLRNALPALREAGVPATIFLVTDNIGERPRWEMPPEHPERLERVMNLAQIGGLIGEGFHRIESHTHTHRPLGALEGSEIERELGESLKKLHQLGVNTTRYLAAPHGSWDERVCRVASGLGLRLLTLEPVLCRTGSERIGRFSATPDMWNAEFWLLMRGGYAFLPLVRNLVRVVKSMASPARGPGENAGGRNDGDR